MRNRSNFNAHLYLKAPITAETHWLGTSFSSRVYNVKNNNYCTVKNNLEQWNMGRCVGNTCNRGHGFIASIDFGEPMIINAHRYDASWNFDESVWSQKIQSSLDGITWTDANTMQNYTQQDLEDAPDNMAVMEFNARVARYWRWYAADTTCPTIKNWEFKGVRQTGKDNIMPTLEIMNHLYFLDF